MVVYDLLELVTNSTFIKIWAFGFDKLIWYGHKKDLDLEVNTKIYNSICDCEISSIRVPSNAVLDIILKD